MNGKVARLISRGAASLSLNKVSLMMRMANEGYLVKMGFIESWKRRVPVSGLNSPIPWITYPCLRFLEGRLNSGLSVFEFGAGFSTLYFSNRVKTVESVEHDAKWYEKLSADVPSNVKLKFADQLDAYVNSIEGRFDLIMIDGAWRNQCAGKAVKHLTDSGVVLFDDADREEYESAFDHFRTNHFKRIDFWGLQPGSIHENCTAIFYRPENCLGL